MKKLSDYARDNCITYKTAHIHFHKGLIQGAYQLPTGTIVIPDDYQDPTPTVRTAVYGRVSSSENRSNLEGQTERLVQFCTANGWVVGSIIKECASGLNDKRPKLLKLLSDRSIGRIVVEHSDRLTRFGMNYIKTLYPGEIVIVNEAEDDEKDLMQDFVSLVTSFCARLYGQRRSKRKTEKLIKGLSETK